MRVRSTKKAKPDGSAGHRPDGPKMSIFQPSPIRVFLFGIVSLDHGKSKSAAASFKTARLGTFEGRLKVKIF